VIKVNAQYVPNYNNQGNQRSSYDKAAEEARNRNTIKLDVSSKTERAVSETPREKEARMAASRKAVEAADKERYGVYDYIGKEKDGLRPVKLKNKWGYLNREGKVVIPVVYDQLDFNGNGLFGIRLSNKWGFADGTGNVVIPIIYSSVVSGFTSEGIATVSKGKNIVYINKRGVIVYDYKSSFSDGISVVALGEKKGFINGAEKQITALIYDDTNGFSEGMANVKLGNKWGYIDKTGKVVIPLKFDHADIFLHRRASIKMNGKYGFIDKDGNVVIPLQYDYAGRFKDGLALVQVNKKVGYIDSAGTAIIPIIYDGLLPESLGYYALKSGNKWGFLNKKGVTVFPFEYDDVLSNFAVLPKDLTYGSSPYSTAKPAEATVIKDDHQFTIDINGNTGYKVAIAPKGYDTAGAFREGLASVRLNGKWGLINSKREVVIPLLYESQLYPLGGFIAVSLNKKIGFFDITGKAITLIKYDNELSFNSKFPRVKLNGKWGVIDKTGTEIIPLKYDYIEEYYLETFIVQLNNKWGLIDKNNTEIIEIKYEDKCNESDRSLYAIDRNWFIGKYGKEMVPLVNKENKIPKNGLIYFKLNGKYYPFDSYGKKLTRGMIK
jgi:hypothetical protein